MKALIFNCSLHMDRGNTALILDPYVNGMKEEGAQVELLYIRQLDIRACQGDISCWINTPGRCHQRDDVAKLYPKLRQADIIVFAAPVYVDGMPGPMKNLVDRLLPLLEPYFEIREGHCRHALPEDHKHSKVVLVSTCAFWEMDNFNPLVAHMQAICKNACWEYAGALLRPHGSALWYMLKHDLQVHDVIEAAKEAGRQIVRNGKMKEETLKTVSRELGSINVYLEKMNADFKKALSRN